MKTIYEEFNCNNIQELYEKVKSNDPSVRQLTAFIEFSKVNFNTTQRIDNINEALKYVNAIETPKLNEVKTLFLNADKRPVYLSSCDLRDIYSQKQSIANGFNANSSYYVYCIYSPFIEDKKYEENFSNLLENCGFHIIENIAQTGENKFYLQKSNYTYTYDKEFDLSIPNFEHKFSNNIDDLKEYNDFMQYYAKNEIRNLNIFKDKEKINQLLKIAYQDNYLEISGLITSDKNGNIKDMYNIAIGTVDSVNTDNTIIVKHILNDLDIKGIITFHNHPSGNKHPSIVDIKHSKQIQNIVSNLEVDFIDDFVISKQGVSSIRKISPKNFKNFKYINKPLFYLNTEKNKIFDIQNISKSIAHIENIQEYKVRNLIDKNGDINNIEDYNLER